jgi:hypothetical protein
MIGDGDYEEIGGMKGKLKYLEKTCPSATLSTTNPTRLDPGLNPVCRHGKPATNRLSYDMAKSVICYNIIVHNMAVLPE